jgi:hypothetical protein
MALTPDTLNLIVQPIGNAGLRMFSYRTDDDLTALIGDGYFVNADRFGLRLSDLIFVTPIAMDIMPYVLTMDYIDADGDGTAVVADSDIYGVPESDSWMNGRPPAIIERATPKFLMPEMYIGLETQIDYCDAGNPADFAGATNFKPAFDAMREEMLTLLEDTEWPPTWQRHKFGIALQPGQRYAIEGGINFTGFQTRGLLFAGNGAQIIGRYDAGAPMLDLLGSAGWIVRDLSLECDNNSAQNPSFGVMFGRHDKDVICEGMHFDRLRVDGWFRQACVYNYASELSMLLNPQVYSYRMDAPAYWIDSRNTADVGLYSQHDGIVAVSGDEASCITHKVVGGYLRNIQENQWGCVRIDSSRTGNLNNVRGVYIDGTYFTNNGTDTDQVRPAIRVRGPVDDLIVTGHGEPATADSVVNLSHFIYYDTADNFSPLRQHRHHFHEYFSDCEIAFMDKSDAADNLTLTDCNISVGYQRGQYPAATYAKLFGANMTAATVKFAGTVSTGDIPTDPTNFLNLDLVTGDGTLLTEIATSNIDMGAESRWTIRSSNSATRGYSKGAVLLVTANGAIAVNFADIIRLSSAVTSISFSNGFAYHKFAVFNDGTNFVKVSGLAGPDSIIPPGCVMIVEQYQSAFAAVSPPFTNSYTPTLTNVTNIDASTAQVCRYRLVGTDVTVWGDVLIDPTAAASTASELGISLPVASAMTSARDLAGSGASAVLATAYTIMGDSTNDRASMQFVSGTTANHSVRFQFSYTIK